MNFYSSQTVTTEIKHNNTNH